MKNAWQHFAALAGRAAAAAVSAACISAARAAAPAAPATVPVILSASSDNAAISVDGSPRGSTPVQVQLVPGRHLAKIEAPGQAPVYAEFESGETPSEAFFELPKPLVQVLVRSEPEGAAVTLDGASVGTTPLLLPSVEPGRRTFGFTHPGYKPQLREAALAAPGPVRIDAELESSTATIVVESVPAGAEIIVNGTPRGRTPAEIAGLPEGESVVEVAASGYKPWRAGSGPLSAGSVARIEAILEPLPAVVEIVTIPSGARIYVDDAFAGVSPLVSTNASAGPHRIRADLSGHAPLARTVDLAPGVNPVQELRLRQTGGHLFLSTAPAGVDVAVDGVPRGRTSGTNGVDDAVSGVFAVSNLSAGPHVAVLTRPGWEKVKRDFTIGEGKSQTFETIEMTRKFIPDFQIDTKSTGIVRGMFVEKTEDYYRIEVSPGVVRAIPKTEIVRVAILRHDRENAEP